MDHVWSYDFIEDALLDGRKIRILNILDEFTREWVAVKAGVSMSGKAVVGVLLPLFRDRGAPGFLRSDNGGEFIANEVKEALTAAGAAPFYIDPGSPWQNGFVESFHGKLRDEFLDAETFLNIRDEFLDAETFLNIRDEFLDAETFLNIREAQVCLEEHRRFYNQVRPHSSLHYQTPNQFRQKMQQNQQTNREEVESIHHKQGE